MMAHRQDMALGAIFAVLGVVAAWLAGDYTGASGLYPRVLGLILLALGVLIVVRAVRSTAHQQRMLMEAPGKWLLAAVVFVVYVAVIVPLGFYTASVLLMLVLPLLLGFRRPLYLGLMAVIFMAVLYLMFTVVLEKPLPAEIWSSSRLVGE